MKIIRNSFRFGRALKYNIVSAMAWFFLKSCHIVCMRRRRRSRARLLKHSELAYHLQLGFHTSDLPTSTGPWNIDFSDVFCNSYF